MYIGRIVAIARTDDDRLCALYRVSSRSFPNRAAAVGINEVSIIPKAGHEGDIQKNPYITYHCVRIACDGRVAVVSNGSHTDPIAEKIAGGAPVRDAIALSLSTLDYEKDSYNTPRICAVVDKRDGAAGWLGVVRIDGLEVKKVALEPGTFAYVATYEENGLHPGQSGSFPAKTPLDSCKFILSQGVFAQRECPITAVAAMSTDAGFEFAAMDAG
ncbi:MAG: IMP cyclohydrolase [Candidatus Hydrogenedentes bacterium]|nr:IMP cyclohydrolase [Candidatus Hydrogenedentota bacterium]